MRIDMQQIRKSVCNISRWGVLFDLLGEPDEAEEDDEEAPEALEGIEQLTMDDYYRLLLDTPSPGLRGKTPREMAHSPKTKHRHDAALFLIAMEMAANAERSEAGQPPYDASWMWEELGLTDLRKS